MLGYYYNRPPTDFLNRTEWNKDDPNILDLSMPGWVVG